MEQNEEMRELKSESMTLEDISKWFSEAHQADIDRRERMDKVYTPIGDITDKEIDDVLEQYGGIDNVPNGLFVKVKLAGSYMDMPFRGLVAMKEACKREWEKQYKK